MVLISKTGLLEGIKNPVRRHVRAETVHFPVVAGPAPYALRPYAGVYNPFPYGCSILCNHPADFEAKDVVRRAKDTWASEGRAALAYGDGEAAVPEELFRRYTDTDSRPPTPAPTLASAGARGSGRRCVTPDAATSATASASAGSAAARGRSRCGGGRTLLVLDLRRSRSQGALPLPPPSPPTPPPHLPPAPGSLSSASAPASRCSKASSRKRRGPAPAAAGRGSATAPPPAGEPPPLHKLQLPPIHKMQPSPETSTVLTDTTGGSGDEDLPRRRGKRRKRGKKGRDGSREPEKEFQGMPEPGETQVSALPLDSRAASARPSFSAAPTPAPAPTPANSVASAPPPSATPATPPPPAHVSFLDAAVLRHLQRELDHEVVDSEFQPKKHKALEEALKARPHEKRRAGEEMRRLKKELHLPPSDTELWLTLPRIFSRQSSRFELPLDSRTLNKMSPLQYLQSHVDVSSGRKLLYNMVFNRHKEELDDEDTDRRMKGENVVIGLEEVMGAPLSDAQIENFRSLVGWQDSDKLDFRTWCGICAACERLLGPQFSSQVASKEDDPCHEVEKADFETLPRKLQGLAPDPRLLTILNGIREL
ncbi:serine/arginine repetitive matrix protein 1 [Schistocerca gregaria]|uniref:serine/arginine repetitive matrix protein 1 n=1 Tax=Schistocerca gregaria TaxID=7010 RepID=UPI00211F2744|nr:serine/arginine repetitive matrix protein 1 [Schistocerca gregaria]